MNLEAKNFDYSMKNIPIPTKNNYLKCLVEKVESLIIRMRWKALFYNSDDNETRTNENRNYGFKSKKTPPQDELLKPFEEDLINLIRNIKFQPVNDSFLQKLNDDVKEINNINDVLVFADKTTNVYPVSKEAYKKLLKENIT